MKKNRPGTMINVICAESEKDAVIKALFKYSTTIGIRENKMNRYILDRKVETVETPDGPVRCKISSGYGIERRKFEYDDLAKIAKEKGMSIRDVERIVNDSL